MTPTSGIIFLTFLVLNFLSLYLVAYKNRTMKHLAGLGFLFGDFFLIPLYFGLTINFLFNKTVPPNIDIAAGLISIVVTVFFGKKFNLLRPIWFLHGLIMFSIVYLLILVVATSITKQDYWALTLGLAILISHQFLGAIFPKKL